MPSFELPKLGFGTVDVTDPETIATALKIGYRHIDTAQWYENESIVGRGIELSDVPRENLVVATKVLPEHLGADDVRRTTQNSLDRLGVDTVDVLYVHWPTNAYDPVETLGAFNELYREGKIRYVGLSNFTPSLLTEAIALLDAPTLAVQVEMHPLFQQRELLEYVREADLHLVAYSPLAQGQVFDDPVLMEVATELGVSVAQVSLAWLLSKENVVAIPKASGDHIRDNYEALSLDLPETAIECIDALDRELRTVNPAGEEKVDDTPWEK
jgi:2,5-diketo-D-gluconate reductase B